MSRRRSPTWWPSCGQPRRTDSICISEPGAQERATLWRSTRVIYSTRESCVAESRVFSRHSPPPGAQTPGAQGWITAAPSRCVLAHPLKRTPCAPATWGQLAHRPGRRRGCGPRFSDRAGPAQCTRIVRGLGIGYRGAVPVGFARLTELRIELLRTATSGLSRKCAAPTLIDRELDATFCSGSVVLTRGRAPGLWCLHV